jgi:hypothetical protein
MAVTLGVPDSFDGRIDPETQVDKYRVWLDDGSSYTFDVFGGEMTIPGVNLTRH